MAGWIPLEKDILTDPRFRRFVAAYHAMQHPDAKGHVTDDRYACNGAPFSCVQCMRNCIGMLTLIWMHADTHITEDDCLEMDQRELAILVGFSDVVPVLEECSRGTWLQDLGDRIKLPGYQRHNGMEAKERKVTAKRVARYRKRHGVTGVTQERYIDQREQAQKDKCNGSALPDQTKPHHTNTKKSTPVGVQKERRRTSGERIPDDFVLNPTLAAIAHAEGLQDAERLFADFRDYWVAKPGQDGVKLDWTATWRRWCRTEAARRQERTGGRSGTARVWPTRSTQESALATIERLTQDDDEPDENTYRPPVYEG